MIVTAGGQASMNVSCLQQAVTRLAVTDAMAKDKTSAVQLSVDLGATDLQTLTVCRYIILFCSQQRQDRMNNHNNE